MYQIIILKNKVSSRCPIQSMGQLICFFRSCTFNWIEFPMKLNRNCTKMGPKLNRIWTEIEQKLNGNWGRTMKDQFRVPGVHAIIYKPGAINRSFIVRVLNFHSISVQILFNFCSISVPFAFNCFSISIEIPFNWMEIEQDRKKQVSWPYIKLKIYIFLTIKCILIVSNKWRQKC